jgi:4-aminobutyrate aminotransferase-like enzyme
MTKWTWLEDEERGIALYDQTDRMIIDVIDGRLCVSHQHRKLIEKIPELILKMNALCNNSAFADMYDDIKKHLVVDVRLQMEEMRWLMEEMSKEL